VSTTQRTFPRRSRTRRTNPTRAFAAGFAGLAIVGVLAASVYGAVQGPTRAAAASGSLPQGAIGIGTRFAPRTAAVTGADKVGSATGALTSTSVKKSVDPREAQRKAFARAKARKKAADRAAYLKRLAAKRRAAAIAAAKRLKWRSALCSTYGIGDGLVGNGMAGGGVLRSNWMVVAPKTMKFGTKIKFSYRGRTCVAEVRDRGPYVGSRVFDLGPGTAKALGFDGVGTVKYAIVK